MIDENDGWIEDNFTLQDSEKFKVMIKVYEDIFVDTDTFADKIGAGRSTVYDWIQKEKASLQTKSKKKICDGFKLLDSVWSDKFPSEYIFEESLPNYKKIEREKPKGAREMHTLVKLDNINLKDSDMQIDTLSDSEIDALLSDKLENKSDTFMFEFAKKLKSKKRIQEALNVLDWVEKKESAFRYTHENNMRHLRAILLSHDDIKQWDEAIHILRSLYHGSQYHLKEPEVVTLLASNYKRKALDGYETKDKIDMKLITSALCLYEDGYNLKSDNEKYYDAVNLAYLYAIVDSIEIEQSEDKKEILKIYKELLKIWRVDTKNWWEVCSDAEFLMLTGDIDLAIMKMGDFLENHEVDAFEIDATIRQLKLYIHFTDDGNAKRFLDFLESYRENINN